jgi:hypothetical protein
VTSVVVSDEGAVVVVYVVKDVQPETQDAMESSDMAAAIADSLQEGRCCRPATYLCLFRDLPIHTLIHISVFIRFLFVATTDGFDGADVQPAEAAVITVDIAEVPIVEATFTATGVTIEEAQSEDFEIAVEKAVAANLGVDSDSVDVVSVEEGEDGAVVVTFQVADVDVLDQLSVEKALEGDDMSEAIATELETGT